MGTEREIDHGILQKKGLLLRRPPMQQIREIGVLLEGGREPWRQTCRAGTVPGEEFCRRPENEMLSLYFCDRASLSIHQSL